MPNKLAGENSPYLLQHSNNPVNWYPWGQEALELARHEGKPIFLSIGYTACHWCHVMAHESFEDPDTAAIMNRYFINIKVDREERPDIDDVYMNAVIAMTGHGGWPTSVFLAPDGKPFFGGTYFPSTQRYNLPSFTQVLLSVAQTWDKDPEGILNSSNLIYQHIQNSDIKTAKRHNKPTPELLDQATQTLTETYDWKYGGWGHSPKFPQAMTILFLVRRAWRGDRKTRDMVSHALKAMAQGGMYDVVGGGFARYSTDEQWHIPHFEKMLYDNALLSQAYLHAYLITKDDLFRRVCVDTLDFILRELTHPLGGFFSSLDADSEGVEGKYYLWTLEEIRKLLGNDADFFIKAYNITEAGDFEGKTILQRSQDDTQLAHLFNISVENIPSKLATLHAILRVERNRRVPPSVDDKILVSWNALMLSAFAEAGRYLRMTKYAEAARRNAEFLLQHLIINDRLYRSWRDGRSMHPAYLEDYAALSLALLDLYQTDPQTRWFTTARNLTIQQQSLFSDQAGGFYDTAIDHETLIIRPKTIQDNATPCGNSLAAYLLLQLSAYTGMQEWQTAAEEMIASVAQTATRYPTSFAQWLSAIDFSLHPIQEVAILGDIQDPQTRALIDCLWSEYMPNAVVAISKYPPDEGAPELLNSRTLINGLPTAYVCQNFTCKLPVNTASDLLIQLK